MVFNVNEAFERSQLINEHGILLDDCGNELRDETGEITIIPTNKRKHFRVLECD